MSARAHFALKFNPVSPSLAGIDYNVYHQIGGTLEELDMLPCANCHPSGPASTAVFTFPQWQAWGWTFIHL